MSSLPPDHALGELLAFVRAHSPFYKDFYAAVPPGSTRLADYPVLDSQRFWAANTVQDNQVFTAPVTEGITFKSGGTTGQPKYSVFTHAEWRSFTDAFGQGMRRAGLQPGDRIQQGHGGDFTAREHKIAQADLHIHMRVDESLVNAFIAATQQHGAGAGRPALHGSVVER